ncbi:hypothetical protein [Nocardioides sp. SYSU D00038]|uniref:hypothetical protein n=1 Tax=Nocardioides sp. SYSU D00038 TaxID=2812554 RepID=UPI001968933E|nr:hypothetical protein [Nocardioides sp. SYSU D00038]
MDDTDRRMLELLAQGRSHAAVIDELGLTERSLRTRLTNLRTEFGARTTIQLGAEAVRAGHV